jgi:methionyl-tRNA formyltransferase
MDRLVIFTEFSDFETLAVPTVLTQATLQASADRSDVEVVGVCIRGPHKYPDLLLRHLGFLLERKAQSLFDHGQGQTSSIRRPMNAEKLARRYGFQILEPPDQNINHPEFIAHLRTAIRPTLALSFYCLQRFAPALLEVLGHCANYHDGLLPKYRGVMATAWSMYYGEEESGYTFHRMNESFDEGGILLEDAVAITPNARRVDLECQKALKAVHDIPRLLDMLVRRQPGRAQAGASNYFSLQDLGDIRRIADPSQHSSVDLTRRLRAFDFLVMNIGGKWYDVTKLTTLSAPPEVRRELAFRTHDGVVMQATRFLYLPFPLYRVLRRTGLPLPSESGTPGAGGAS